MNRCRNGIFYIFKANYSESVPHVCTKLCTSPHVYRQNKVSELTIGFCGYRLTGSNFIALVAMTITQSAP